MFQFPVLAPYMLRSVNLPPPTITVKVMVIRPSWAQTLITNHTEISSVEMIGKIQ